MQLSLPLDETASPDVRPASPLQPASTPQPRPTSAPPLKPQADPAGGPSVSITFVRRRRARRYVLRVDGEGSVRVTIPRGGSRREAIDFVERHRTWIERQRERVRPPSLSAAERASFRRRAEAELPLRLLALAAAHGLHVTRISIRNQRTRWGSCGRNGHITLNWRLVLMPDWVSDYVLVHELMHLRRLDHSPAYWALVAAAYPRFREARAWLRQNAEPLR
jgi:predicted metal-dependent hydrolase